MRFIFSIILLIFTTSSRVIRCTAQDNNSSATTEPSTTPESDNFLQETTTIPTSGDPTPEELLSSEKNDTTITPISSRSLVPVYLLQQPCNCTSLFQCDLGGGGGGATSSSTSSSFTPVARQPPTNPQNQNRNQHDGPDSDDKEDDDDYDGADVSLVDIRIDLPPGHGPCKHYLEICCNLYQTRPRPPPHNSQLTKRPDQASPSSSAHSSPSPSSSPQQCGRRNVHGVGFRIVGNVEGEAQMGEFTWMAAVTEVSKVEDGTVYLCGGSIIHPRVILTAAHCIENKAPETLRVRVGEWDTQTEREEPYVHYDRSVERVIIHENYSKRNVLKNDIAIILLSREIPLARHIGGICLSRDIAPKPGQICFASGWGKNLFGKEGAYQNILKKVELPAVSRSECESVLRTTRLGHRFRLHESFLCAGGQRNKDTCKGDGGSPLVCQIPGSDQYALYGIVSWGLNCGDPIPGVYVNVPHFVPWIEHKFMELALDTRYFRE